MKHELQLEMLRHRVKMLEQEIRKTSPKLLYMENRIRELEETITSIRKEMGRGE